MTRVAEGPPPVAAGLLTAAGAAFLLSAVLYNEFLLGWIVPDAVSPDGVKVKIRLVQLYLAGLGLAGLALGTLAGRTARLRTAAADGRVVNLLLVVLVVLVPLTVAELTLRPFVVLHRKTTIFQRDPDLGWRLRPGVRDRWHGTPVSINAKGLRGPEVDYAKREGIFRVLYLGDSVTFGYGIEDPRLTFPYRTGRVLAERSGVEVETVNAGVGGYSPWQERLFLEREGLKYEPDLVVVSFVLNDVTEKLELVRFGGDSEGAQLANTYASVLDRLASHSSVVSTLRRIGARMRFGADVREGARRREVFEVQALIERPDDPEIVQAWELTRKELRGIFALCRDHDIPVLVVVFPFVFQLDDVDSRSGPQRIVAGIAAEENVPLLDLLPRLAEAARVRDATPRDWFLDADHPSPSGSEVVAELIAERILSEGWIDGRAARP